MCLTGYMEEEDLDEKGIKGNHLHGSGNASHAYRIYRNVNLNKRVAKAPPKLSKEAHANDSPKA